MKRLFIILASLSFFVTSCDSENVEISPNNIFESVLPRDGMIQEAEKSLGVLYKEERIFTDGISGSEFKMIFAANSKKSLENFFSTNTIELKGVDAEAKAKIANAGKRVTVDNNSQLSQSTSNTPDFVESEVYYDLVSRKLKGKDVGLSFSIKPNKSAVTSSPSARMLGLNWRQQTSLPWCEYAHINMIYEAPIFPGYPFNAYQAYSQTRGWIWSNSRPFNQYFYTDGSTYVINTDAHKFTRFGGYDDVISKFTVIWYDVESGDQEPG